MTAFGLPEGYRFDDEKLDEVCKSLRDKGLIEYDEQTHRTTLTPAGVAENLRRQTLPAFDELYEVIAAHGREQGFGALVRVLEDCGDPDVVLTAARIMLAEAEQAVQSINDRETAEDIWKATP